jgi:hypothetical protein
LEGTEPALLLVAVLELGNEGNLLVAASGVLVASPAWSIHPKLQRKKNVAASAGEERRT